MELTQLTPIILIKIGFMLGVGVCLAQFFCTLIAGLIMSPFATAVDNEEVGK